MTSVVRHTPVNLDILTLRADMFTRMRAFFDARGVLEVDTPALSTAAPTDVHVHSLHTEVAGAGRRWLHTSPEYRMKGLLAAGSGDIWQLCRVFRDDEYGRLHAPEFMLLEWYRCGMDELQLAMEVDALLRHLLDGHRTLGPARVIGCDQAIEETTGRKAPVGEEFDRLMATVTGPALGHDGPCIVTDWPVEHAALARIRNGKAARFEVFIDGIELANGYHELADAAEQRARFDTDNAAREARGLPRSPVDERLLATLDSGLPDCAGVALGFDRVVMLAAGATGLSEVVTGAEYTAW